jgi:hypothetical protein
MVSKGMHLSTWNLRRSAPPARPGQRRPRSSGVVDAGVYRMILMVDGKEVQTKKLEILDDPILNTQ